MEKPENVCAEKVFNEVFKLNAQDIFNFLHYKYRDEDDAKDVMQEVFSKLWNNCMAVTPEKARGYLFVVANNLMKNILSKKSTAQKHQKHLVSREATAENPHYLMEESEFSARLNEALSALPDDQRITLLMKRVEGKKQKEIAEILGISEKAVEKRLSKAMLFLRSELGNIF